jgi:hypothetical protein
MVNQVHRLDLSQIDSPRIRHFDSYWHGKRTMPGAVPLRSDFDPAEARELLPNMVIMDVEQEPLRFRYRLVGTRVVEFNNLEFTGRYLGTIGWQEERQLVETCTAAALGRTPLFGSYTWTLKNGAIGKCEFGLFPFSNDGHGVAQLFGLEDYDFPRDQSGARPRKLR